MEAITLGYDPEFFLETISNGELYPSIGLFGGTKEEKRPLPELGEGFGIEEDNVAVEMTAPPASTKDVFVNQLLGMVGFLETEIPELKGVPALQLSRRASGNFLEKYLQSEQACTFGCSPEMNAYNYDVFTADAGEAANFRTCGGHIHIGWKGKKSIELAAQVIRAMDLYLGVPSLFMDTDAERRKLYGKAGSCRQTPYGVEYRTLSNFWCFGPEKMEWAYEQTMRALQNLDKVENMYSDLCFDVQDAINEADMALAETLVNTYSLAVVVDEEVVA